VEKAVAANASAVREWDSNGTNFGYDATKGRTAGEFGHNEFYPVAVAAARESGHDGDATLRVMVLIDEIRGRLAEVFALRKYSIDHVHHGAVACAAAYTAALGGTIEQEVLPGACKHGRMKFWAGKDGNPRWYCPLPKENPDRCEWVKA
jgi:2-methylcitrate dehydratase